MVVEAGYAILPQDAVSISVTSTFNCCIMLPESFIIMHSWNFFWTLRKLYLARHFSNSSEPLVRLPCSFARHFYEPAWEINTTYSTARESCFALYLKMFIPHSDDSNSGSDETISEDWNSMYHLAVSSSTSFRHPQD